MMSKLLRNACAAAVLGLGVTSGAFADVVLNFSEVFDGKPAPVAATPWLTATIEDTALNTVKVTLDYNLSFGKVSEFYFNLGDNSAAFPITGGLTATYVSGQAASSVTMSSNAYKADGDGKYDLLFDYAPGGGGFGPGEQSVYTLVATGLSAALFDNWSLPDGGVGPYRAGAHLQAINTAGDSTWVHPGDGGTPGPTPIPLPASVWAGMALLGGVGLMRFHARRRQLA